MLTGEELLCRALGPWARVPSSTLVHTLEGRLFRGARATEGPLEFLASTGIGRRSGKRGGEIRVTKGGRRGEKGKGSAFAYY
jgi:hypothetical protein